jgi:aspartate aminotransferase
MPHISDRGRLMPPSPIRKLVPFSEAAKKRGIKVYHLNIGQPDIPTPEIALEAIRSNTLKVIEYSHSAGIESYRRKLASYYQGIGIPIDYTQIITTTGGSEAIIFALMSCLNIGDELIVAEPFYANYNGFSITSGVNVVPVTSRIEDGFALPKLEEFEKHMGPKTRGIIICNPNNPTGYLYSRDELERLGQLVHKHDLFLFSDEVYREFCYDGQEHFSAMKLKGLEENVVLLDSVSKRYSMCGVRIGALISRNMEVISTALKFGQARLSPPSLGQIAAEAALDTPPAYFEQVYSEYISRRNFMVETLNKIPGVLCPTPRGAFYSIARLPVDDADKFCEWLLREFSWQNQTVMLAPASGFYNTPGLGRN